MFVPQNPYITLQELLEELKWKQSDATAPDKQDELQRAIQNASRWVDNYTRRDYFFHDHTVSPMVFDQYDEGVYGRDIFPRSSPIIAVTKIELEDEELDAATEYIVKNTDEDQRIVSLLGDWFATSRFQFGSTARRTIEIFGTFGYLQNTSYPVTVAGDTDSQLSALTFTGRITAPVYWKLTRPATDVSKLELFSDSGMTAKVAEGQSEVGGSSVYCIEMNGSGIYLQATVTYTADDTDVANILTPGAGVYSSAAVPTGLPGKITLATRLVAAAISGHNKKEIVDVAGGKVDIATSAIPKTVFDLLGRKAPILI